MTIGMFAAKDPDRQAIIIVETGQSITYGDLERRSESLARSLLNWGLQPGDRIAVFMENRIEFFEVLWAALRLGLRLVPVNRFLKAEEAAYIVEDSDSRALFASDALGEVARGILDIAPSNVTHYVATSAGIPGYASLEQLISDAPALELPDAVHGTTMFYTSGTTGQPKGAIVGVPTRKYSEGLGEFADWIAPMMGFEPGNSVFIAAPVYHSAPCSIAIAALACGGTLVLMQKFDAAAALDAMQTYKVRQGYLVPTMMLRILKLPDAERSAFDPSNLVCLLHTGEPCAPVVKKAIIDWWGPVLLEMYGASELPQGGTLITSEEWLRKPGSVGRAFDSTIHILDDQGRELPVGTPGNIYFEIASGAATSSYHKQATKADDSGLADNWIAFGDIGYLDDEGFLFLTERKHHMVISGGVNIYPRESEVVLLMHPDILDAACFGIPDTDMGERLVAAVQLKPGTTWSDETEERLISYCKSQIAGYKCPRQIFFEDELPRLPTGKIYKNVLRDKYAQPTTGTHANSH
jgi:long-chain acyl-CoA synthetase